MKKILLPIIILPLLVGCADKDMFSNIHIKPNTTLPVGTAIIADTTLFRLAGLDDEIQTNAEGVLSFSVQGQNKLITPKNVNQIFTLQPQNLAFDLALTLSVDPGQVPLDGFAASAVMNLKLGQRIDQLRVQSGTVLLQVASAGDYSNVRCQIPEITKNGIPITVQVGMPLIIDETYIIKPQYSVGHKSNYLMLNFSGSTPYVPRFTGNVSIVTSGVAYVEGFLGTASVVKSSSSVEPADDSFNEFTSQAKLAYFANPSIDIKINSTVNIPVMLQVMTLEVDGKYVNLREAYNCDRFLIRPEEQTPTFRIDNSVTTTGRGFSDAITKDFKKITITVEATINPTAEDLKNESYVPTNMNSFVKEDVIELFYSVNLPFDCNLQGVKFVQNINLDLSDIAQNPDQKYEELAMLIGGYNQLPMTLKINPFVAQGDNPNATRTYLFKVPFEMEGTQSPLKPSDAKFEPYKMDYGEIFAIDKSLIDKILVANKLFLDIEASTTPNKDEMLGGSLGHPATRKFYSPCELGLDIVIGAKADINLTPTK